MPIFDTRRYWKYFIIVVTTGIISAFLAELGFRALGDRPSADLEGMFVQLGERNFKLAPDLNTDALWHAGLFSVHSDMLGMRCDGDRNFAVTPGDKLDIMFVGDSQGFGHGLNFDQTIAGAFAEMAKRKGLRVANASVAGHTLANQFHLIQWLTEQCGVKVKNFVLLLTPKLIVNCDAFRQYKVGSDGRLYSKSMTASQLAVAKIRTWPKTKTVIYGRLRDALRNSGLTFAAKETSEVFTLYQNLTGEDPVYPRLIDSLNGFVELSRQHQGSVFLVYVPLTIESDFAPIKQLAGERGEHLDRERPFRLLASTAMRLGLPTCDLRSVLEKVHSEGHPLNVKADSHYSGVLSIACASNLWSVISSSKEVAEPIIP